MNLPCYLVKGPRYAFNPLEQSFCGALSSMSYVSSIVMIMLRMQIPVPGMRSKSL